jgi:hypothetical protein
VEEEEEVDLEAPQSVPVSRHRDDTRRRRDDGTKSPPRERGRQLKLFPPGRSGGSRKTRQKTRCLFQAVGAAVFAVAWAQCAPGRYIVRRAAGALISNGPKVDGSMTEDRLLAWRRTRECGPARPQSA